MQDALEVIPGPDADAPPAVSPREKESLYFGKRMEPGKSLNGQE